LLFIDVAIADDFVGERRFASQYCRNRQDWKIVPIVAVGAGGLRWRRSRTTVDPLYNRLGNRKSIVSEVVFQMGSVFANAIGPDGAAILKMNDFRRRAGRRQRQSGKQQEDDRCPH